MNLTLNHSFFFFFSFFLRWGFSLKFRQALSSVCNSGWIWNQSSLPASPSQDCKWWSQCAEVTSAFESILPLPSISVKHGNCCRLSPLFNVQKAFSCLYTDHLKVINFQKTVSLLHFPWFPSSINVLCASMWLTWIYWLLVFLRGGLLPFCVSNVFGIYDCVIVLLYLYNSVE